MLCSIYFGKEVENCRFCMDCLLFNLFHLFPLIQLRRQHNPCSCSKTSSVGNTDSFGFFRPIFITDSSNINLPFFNQLLFFLLEHGSEHVSIKKLWIHHFYPPKPEVPLTLLKNDIQKYSTFVETTQNLTDLNTASDINSKTFSPLYPMLPWNLFSTSSVSDFLDLDFSDSKTSFDETSPHPVNNLFHRR